MATAAKVLYEIYIVEFIVMFTESFYSLVSLVGKPHGAGATRGKLEVLGNFLILQTKIGEFKNFLREIMVLMVIVLQYIACAVCQRF